MNKTFQDLKSEAKENTMMYERVKLETIQYYPISGMFLIDRLDDTKVEVGFEKDGLNYLIYTLRNVIDVLELEWLYHEDSSKFAEMVREARTEQLKSRKTERILAIDKNNNVRSVLTNYTPISDVQIVDLIESADLADNIQHYTQNVTRTDVFIFSKHEGTTTLDGPVMLFGIALTNGQTGVTSLRYHIWISIDDYSLELPHVGRSRHQGEGVNEVFENAKIALEEGAAIEWWENQKKMASKASAILQSLYSEGKISDNRYEELDIALGKAENNADAFVILSAFTARNGFKTIVKKIVKQIS